MRDIEKEGLLRQILQHPCPACGHQRTLCEWASCLADAEFDAWFGSGGGLMRRMKVCADHVKESYAVKNGAEIPKASK